MPFSDPLADGPVIQQATQIALRQGATVAGCLAAVAELPSRGVSVPLVLMGYYAVVGFGIATPAQARAVGEYADGIIVGSACVKTIGDAADPVAAAEQFSRSFNEALTALQV